MDIKKLDRSDMNVLTRQELKAVIITYYYPDLKAHAEQDTKLWEDNFKREMIETRIKDNYGTTGTVIFSINGSPPKGVGVLLNTSFNAGQTSGTLSIFGNRRTSRKYWVIVK